MNNNISLTRQPTPVRMKPFKHTQQYAILLKPLALCLNKQILPSETDYHALSDALGHGDQPMDDLLDWLFSDNPAQRKKQFEQALHHGIDSIDHCPPPLKDFFDRVDTPPAWVDVQKLQYAQVFMAATGLNANYVLRDAALMGGYLLSGLNQALVLTGALNKGASQRLAETSKWWMDCTEKNGLNRYASGFKSTIHVRMIHALVRRNLKTRQEWKMEEWGLPINQIDIAATNLAFCSLWLLGLRGLGIFPNRQESEAVMHFWKYLGWLMGVEEKWLADNETDGLIILYHCMQTQPPADWTSKALGAALAKEPLEKEFKNLVRLRQRFDYHKHLSISRYFLGPEKMQLLGLPDHILPWFPALIIPKNLTTFRLQRRISWLRKKQAIRGRQQQLNYLATFGSKGKQVIKPQKNHPVYIAG